jgi:hypothetical protein
MTDEKMVESLWAVANGITAFAVLQALAFLYALAKRDFVDAIANRTAVVLVVTATVFATLVYCLGVWKCWDLAMALVPDQHVRIWPAMTKGRIACIVVFNLFVLGVGVATVFTAKPPLPSSLGE